VDASSSRRFAEALPLDHGLERTRELLTVLRKHGIAALSTRATADEVAATVAAHNAEIAERGNGKAPRREFTIERCVEAVRRCSEDLGQVPLTGDYVTWRGSHPGEPSLPTLAVRLGPWREVLEAANLPRPYRASERRAAYSHDDIEDSLRSVMRLTGALPSVQAYNRSRPAGGPSSAEIRRQFGGSWAAALSLLREPFATRAPNPPSRR
jgi:hypothetical protein